MNERIRLLAEQAGMVIVDDEFSTYGKFAEKFAQLIAQECADVCNLQTRLGWHDDRKTQAKLDRDLIKEHFGIKS